MMKKRYLLLLAISLLTIYKVDVYACGEIKELKSSDGTVTVVDGANYLITLTSDISAVTLSGTTDYEWVKGFEPRRVSTNETAQLKVNGNSCGYGIYTYFVKFNKVSSIIAENTPPIDSRESMNNEATTDNNNPSNETDNPSSPDNPSAGQLILKNLTIKDYDIDFNPYKYEYTIDVGMDVNFLEIKTEKESENVSVSVSDNAYSLKEGENVIAVTLIDDIGNSSVYNIKVNKIPPKSNNNFLASLIVDEFTVNFDPAKNVYPVQIGKELSLTIHYTTQDSKASVEILGNAALHTGSIVTIKVTAEDGSVRDYVLEIEKVFNIMDYWIYIVVALLVVLLIILLIINKKNKNKKNLGPKAIEGEQNTAGVVQEIASQNISTTPEPQATANGSVSMSADVTVGTLKIIEPTNIENQGGVETVITSTAPVDEDNSPTEVFKL